MPSSSLREIWTSAEAYQMGQECKWSNSTNEQSFAKFWMDQARAFLNQFRVSLCIARTSTHSPWYFFIIPHFLIFNLFRCAINSRWGHASLWPSTKVRDKHLEWSVSIYAQMCSPMVNSTLLCRDAVHGIRWECSCHPQQRIGVSKMSSSKNFWTPLPS